MPKKKVLVWETLATVSGGQKMTLTVMDMLSDKFDFCCLIPAEGMMSEELKKRNIPYILMGDQTLPTGVKGKQVIFRYGWMSVKNIWKSLGVIRRYKPDILYAPGPAALPWSAVCGTLTHKPVIWHLHHIFLDGATKKLLNLCGRWKAVREIIAVSNCVGDQIVNEDAHGKIRVLYNPVDVEKYSNGSSSRIAEKLKNEYNFEVAGRLALGHVALIQRSKRQDFVLKVIKRLQEEGKDVVGLFAGEVREDDYLKELKESVLEMDIEDNVLFLGRRSDIPDLLKTLDILMIPSFEGFPLAGLEAAAAGVPVVACDTAGAKEFINVSGDGMSFKEDNVEAAVSAVHKVMQSKKEMVSSGIKFAEESTLACYTKQINAIFRLR